MKESKILAALATASEDDLTQIDEQIEKLTAQLETLKQARQIVDVRVNGRKPRPKPQRKGASPPPVSQIAGQSGSSRFADPMADRIHKLIEEDGPMSVKDIATEIGCSPPTIYHHAKTDGRFGLKDGKLCIK